MKNLLLLSLVIIGFNVFAGDEDDDIHPRCPFKYYQNVDRVSLCQAYDSAMGNCEGDSQIECSTQAFEEILTRYPVKKQEINFDEIEEKEIEKSTLKNCKFANLEKNIECEDGRVYVLKSSAINDVSRDINKKIKPTKSIDTKFEKIKGSVKK